MVRPPARSLAVVAVAVALLAACTGSTPEDSETSLLSSTTGVAAGPAERSLEGWARSTSEALNEGGTTATLAALLAPAGDRGWAVAGTSFDAAGVPRATVWRSDDALRWTGEMVGGRRTEAHGATRRADGSLVVVGRELVGSAGRGAVWVEGEDGFSRAGGGDAFAGGNQVSVQRVAARPEVVVAVGGRSEEGKDDAVAVWRSASGRSWERLPDAEAVFAASGQPFVNEVVGVPAGFVAVGGVRRGDDVDAAVWFSADGTTWEAAAGAPDFVGAGGQSVDDVVLVDDGGLLAVGAGSDGRRSIPVAWRSPDGRAWAGGGATFEQLGQSSDAVGTEVTTVARLGPGLIATGGGSAANRLWGSDDGIAWQEIQLPSEAAGADDFDLDLLAASGTDVVMASSVSGAPHLALLRDARYTEVTATARGFPFPRPSPSFVDVGVADDEAIASVNVTRSGRALGTERDDVRMLTAPDGLAWTEGERSIDRASVFDFGLDPSGRPVAVGGLSPPRATGGRHAFATYVYERGVWRQDEVVPLPGDLPDEAGTRYLDGVATRGDRMVVAGNAFVGTGGAGNVDGAVFTKVGAGRLAPVDGIPGLSGPDDEVVTAACAGPAGFLVAGSVRRGVDGDAAAWFSPDGVDWRQVAAPSFGGPGDQTIDDCVATGTGFVAAGGASVGDVADAAVWTSPDGTTWGRVGSPVLGGVDAQFISGLTVAGAEVVAVGTDSRAGRYSAALWHSLDAGATWDSVELGRPFAADRYAVATSVVIAGDRIVVGGLVDDRAAVWAGPWPLRRGA